MTFQNLWGHILCISFFCEFIKSYILNKKCLIWPSMTSKVMHHFMEKSENLPTSLTCTPKWQNRQIFCWSRQKHMYCLGFHQMYTYIEKGICPYAPTLCTPLKTKQTHYKKSWIWKDNNMWSIRYWWHQNLLSILGFPI